RPHRGQRGAPDGRPRRRAVRHTRRERGDRARLFVRAAGQSDVGGHAIPRTALNLVRQALLGACLLALATACEPRERAIVLACTASVEDSGLLDAVLPEFSGQQPGYVIKVIAVGSGEALALAE